MGADIFRSRRMNDSYEASNNALDRDSDSDADRDIATILQFLIRSGQVRIIAATSPHIYEEDSDDQTCSSRNRPKIDRHPDTSRLKGSDLSKAIKLSSGALNDRHPNASTSAMNPLPSMLKSRELGMNGRQKFSQGDKCQIIQRVLPNKMIELDRYQGKVFCGTFARDGDVFMSAAQDYFIRLYDTSNGRFKLKKLIEARDVGWSILDTVVRFVYIF